MKIRRISSGHAGRGPAKGTPFRLSMLCCALAGLTAMSAVAHADELGDLKTQIQALSAQLNQLEASQKKTNEAVKAVSTAYPPLVSAPGKQAPDLTPTRAEKQMLDAEYVRRGTIPGSFIVPGTNTSLSVGGFVNFQGIYDPTENLGPKFSIGNLDPTGSSARKQSQGSFHFQDKVSRLVVGTSTPSPYGPITTNFGLDFYGYVPGGDNNQALQNNSWGARIVTAYGTIGHFLVGMANSNFIDDPDTPETFDNAGPAGIPAERLPQLRWTKPFSNGGNLSFSLENPQTGYQDTQGNIEAWTKSNTLPDFTAKYEREGPWGHFQVSGEAQDLGYTDQNGARTRFFAPGALIGATINVPKIGGGYSEDNFGGQAWYGALGHYLPDDFGANGPSALAVNNGTAANPTGATQFELQPVMGGTLFYQHWWTSKLRSTLAFGYNHQRLAAFLPADANNAVTTKTVHLNLIYRPIKTVDLGVEVAWGQKTFQASTGYGKESARRIEVGGIWHF
ncbi:MAG TPA: porin [Bordetella sp.]|uniref:porin n=1 Tax=Bordetella sp. TaxID=28081 RepID=UPI002ED48791